MVRTKDSDGIKSNLIVTEVQKRPCLFDTNHPNYGDRAEKARCWEEVCESVVPGWTALALTEKFAAGKEVQKRWRSIRDSYTKAYRQGKCVLPEQCGVGSRRYQYHRQMAFLLRALQNKKPRYSQDRYDSLSEVSNSPQHPPMDDVRPIIKHELLDKPLDLKTKPDNRERDRDLRETKDKGSQVTIPTIPENIQNKNSENLNARVTVPETRHNHTTDNSNEKPAETMRNPQLEIKIDANSILPDDYFDDDKLFMNSLLPLFKKMDDDTRLLCRIEVLKIIRYALQGNKCFEALRIAEDSFFKTRISAILNNDDNDHSRITSNNESRNESKLSMTTRSADGSRPIRKRRMRSPSPLPVQPKRRGPGRPRKIRPPPSDSDDDGPKRRSPKTPKMKVVPVVPRDMPAEVDETYTATSVDQLSTPMFMKMYNLGPSKSLPPIPIQPLNSTPQNMHISVKTEPIDPEST